MKYHIDTIPVWDALHTDSECLLCALKRKTERLLAERSLGASVMSPDTRLKVNELGFCASHSAMLYGYPGTNRLGHGLMMLSHLQTLRPKLDKAGLSPARAQGGKAFSLFKKTPQAEGGKASGLSALASSCLLCKELEDQEKRQAASLLRLYKTDKAFRDGFGQSKGLCLPHTELSAGMAYELLPQETAAEYDKLANKLLRDSLKRLEEELAWFTQKFDYRNTQQPWGNSRDALERTINKLRGWCLGSEPMQDANS